MAFFSFVVEGENAGMRLDAFLAKKVPQASRSFIAEKGTMRIQDAPSKAHAKVQEGQKITLQLPPMKTLELTAENIPLEILHEDEALLIVNKKAGQVVHPTDHGGHITGTTMHAALWHVKKSGVQPQLAHRLDKDTSGVLVFAKTQQALANMQKQFEARTMQKTYYALLSGRIEEPFEVHAALDRDPIHRTRRAVVASGGKDALTYFEPAATTAQVTLVKIMPKTGRTHQIRVHAASVGHALLGDSLYGSKADATSFFLHAASLSFVHPTSKKEMSAAAPFPTHFISEAKKWGVTMPDISA